MNKQRRSSIKRAIELLDNVRGIIQDAQDEEQEAFNNMPESLQESERCSAMEDAIDSMEDAIDSIEEAKEYLDKAIA